MTLENNLNYAMQVLSLSLSLSRSRSRSRLQVGVCTQNERYEEANHIKQEIVLQLQPSQRAQREIERLQVFVCKAHGECVCVCARTHMHACARARTHTYKCACICACTNARELPSRQTRALTSPACHGNRLWTWNDN